jgi:hypothetical protein
VLPSIDLDGQLQLRAVEVERVLADRVLAPELHAKVPVALDPPYSALGVLRAWSRLVLRTPPSSRGGA